MTKLLFCEYIISFSLLLMPSCHSPHVSEKIEKGHTLLHPTQSLIFNIYKIKTESLFYKYRSKLYEIIEIISVLSYASVQNTWPSLVHAPLCFVTQHNAYSESSISIKYVILHQPPCVSQNNWNFPLKQTNLHLYLKQHEC